MAQVHPAGAAVWEAFCAISSGAGLSWAELEAWQRVNGIELTAWERDTVMALDRQAQQQLAEQRQRAVQTSAPPTPQPNRKA